MTSHSVRPPRSDLDDDTAAVTALVCRSRRTSQQTPKPQPQFCVNIVVDSASAQSSSTSHDATSCRDSCPSGLCRRCRLDCWCSCDHCCHGARTAAFHERHTSTCGCSIEAADSTGHRLPSRCDNGWLFSQHSATSRAAAGGAAEALWPAADHDDAGIRRAVALTTSHAHDDGCFSICGGAGGGLSGACGGHCEPPALSTPREHCCCRSEAAASAAAPRGSAKSPTAGTSGRSAVAGQSSAVGKGCCLCAAAAASSSHHAASKARTRSVDERRNRSFGAGHSLSGPAAARVGGATWPQIGSEALAPDSFHWTSAATAYSCRRGGRVQTGGAASFNPPSPLEPQRGAAGIRPTPARHSRDETAHFDVPLPALRGRTGSGCWSPEAGAAAAAVAAASSEPYFWEVRDPATSKAIKLSFEDALRAHGYRLQATGGGGSSEAVTGGNNSCVALATDAQTAREVAIKFTLSPLRLDQEHRLCREISILKRLGSHPNLVRYYDDFVYYHRTFLVVELESGGDLQELISSGDRTDETTLRRIFRGIVRGTRALHAYAVVHRDLNPRNVLLTSEGEAKICDLGSAWTGDLRGLCYASGSAGGGAPAYAAPEVDAEHGYNGFAADSWSLGAILYFMLFAETPFEEACDEEDLTRMKKEAHQRGELERAQLWQGPFAALKMVAKELLHPLPHRRPPLDFVEGQLELGSQN